jgi:hypothetical protein
MAHGIQRPTLTASAINGLPGVTFTGTNQSMQNVTSNILTAGSDRTVMAVVIPTTGTGTFNPGGTVFGFRLGANAWILYLGTTAGTTYGYSSTVATDSLSSPPTIANVAALVECSGTLGGQPTFIHNATTYALTAGVIGNETGTTGFMVGNNPSFATTFNFNGSICELFVYDHVCDAGELAATRAYVEAKYAIALGEP